MTSKHGERSASLAIRLALASVIASCPASRALAATFAVDDLTDAVDAAPGDAACATVTGSCTLRAAVMEANALAGPDEVALPPGTFSLSLLGAGEDAASTGDLDVVGDLRVVGSGASTSIIDFGAVAGDRLIDVRPSARLELSAVTLRGGASPAGEEGGGIRVVDGELAISGCVLTGNAAGTGGGALVGVRSVIEVRACEFLGNTAGVSEGGGVKNLLGPILIEDSRFEANTARAGGGIYSNTGSLLFSVTRSIIARNVATGTGGGVVSQAGTFDFRDVVVEENVAPGCGGACFLEAGPQSQMVNCVIRGNVATVDDIGGLYVQEPALLTSCSIVDNDAAGNAGGLWAALVVLESTTISGNRAGLDGGGLYQLKDGEGSRVINCTITDNEAQGSGGGVYFFASSLELFNTTVTGNRAITGTGGGVQVQEFPRAPLECRNTLIAGNTAGGAPSDCVGDVLSHGYLLIQEPAGCNLTGDVATVLTGVDPLLGPLQDNGGLTMTHALLTGSPALDGGHPAGCVDHVGAVLARDQRGVVRPRDGDGDGDSRCDIGAYEESPFAGLAIRRSTVLTAAGPAPDTASSFHLSCQQPEWALCPEAVVTGDLEGLTLVGEAAASGTGSATLRYYEHSDRVDTMKVARSGDHLVFHAR